MIKDILDESKTWDSSKKIEAAEITDKQFVEILAEHKEHFGESLVLDKYPQGLTSKKLAFAVGEKLSCTIRGKCSASWAWNTD